MPSRKADEEDLMPPPGDFKYADNHIWFYCPIEQGSVAMLNGTIQQMNEKLAEEMVHFKNDKPRPIHLHIHSYGGSLFSGFAAADVIRLSRAPVWTYIEGAAASAATFLSVCGKRRFITENSCILIHQLRAEAGGKHDELQEELENANMQMDIMRRLYEKHTKMKPKKIEQFLRQDKWLDAETAKQLGLVDEVL